MKFGFFDNSETFSGCAQAPTIRLSSRAGAGNKTICSKVWTEFHVSGFVVAGAGLEVVSALVASNWSFRRKSTFSLIIDHSFAVSRGHRRPMGFVDGRMPSEGSVACLWPEFCPTPDRDQNYPNFENQRKLEIRQFSAGLDANLPVFSSNRCCRIIESFFK